MGKLRTTEEEARGMEQNGGRNLQYVVKNAKRKKKGNGKISTGVSLSYVRRILLTVIVLRC